MYWLPLPFVEEHGFSRAFRCLQGRALAPVMPKLGMYNERAECERGNMDPANLIVVVLVGAAVLFLVWLASRNDPNQEPPLVVYSPSDEIEAQKPVSVPEVGREIPFPLDINTVPGVLNPDSNAPKF